MAHRKLGKKVSEHIPTQQQRSEWQGMRQFQLSNKFMMPITKFEKILREIGPQIKLGLYWSKNSIPAIQIAREDLLHDCFKMSTTPTNHARRENKWKKQGKIKITSFFKYIYSVIKISKFSLLLSRISSDTICAGYPFLRSVTKYFILSGRTCLLQDMK